MNLDDLNNVNIPEMPKLAKGTSVPQMNALKEAEIQHLKEEYERKRQFRHDWLIASFSAVSGAVFGFITSLIFWLIEKY